MANQYKVVVQDENGVELGSRTFSVVDTIKLKHKYPGDLGLMSEINLQLSRMLDAAHNAFLNGAVGACDELNITPTDFTNGVAFALMKAWYQDASYKDAEARENG